MSAFFVVAILLGAGLLGAAANLAERRNERFWGRPRHAPAEPITALVIDPLTANELKLSALDHGAESFAANLQLFREGEQDQEETAQRIWNAAFDQAIAEVNQRFDELVRDLPTSEDDPFPDGYWPVVSAVPFSAPPLTLQRLSSFSPEATLAIVQEQNAAQPVFSWTTSGYPIVPAPSAVQRDVRRHRAGRHSRR